MSDLNGLMALGFVPPVVHGVLDYPLAAVLIVLPFVLDFDDDAAKWVAVGLGLGAAVLAVGTAWATGIVKVIPPLLHGYADLGVTVALIVLPFIHRLLGPRDCARFLPGRRRGRSCRNARDLLRIARAGGAGHDAQHGSVTEAVALRVSPAWLSRASS
jgi:hypothetical protein